MEALEKLKREVYTKRIQIANPFHDYDPLRSGLISTAQFMSALGMSSIPLSKPEMEALVALYTSAPRAARDPSRAVSYVPFLAEIESVFTQEDLEASPTKTIPPPPSYSAVTEDGSVKALGSSSPALSVLRRLRRDVATRRMNLLPFFEDFDSHGRRVVTQNQFQRLLATMGLHVTGRELMDLIHRYADRASDTHDIKYIPFLADVDPEGIFETSSLAEAFSTSSASFTSGPTTTADLARDANVQASHDAFAASASGSGMVSVPHVLEAAVSEVARRSLRAKDFFADHDPLRHGLITVPQFIRSLTALLGGVLVPLPLLSQTAQAFTSPSASPPRVVDYHAFLDALKSPPGQAPVTSSPSPVVTQEEALEALESKLGQIRQRVHQRRILVRPLFRDFDRYSLGVIEPKCVIQALAGMGVPVSSSELQLFLAAFPSPSSTPGFGYMAFVEAVDPDAASLGHAAFESGPSLADGGGAAPTSLSASSSTTLAGSNVPLSLLMAKICQWVNTRRVRLSEFVRDRKFHTHRILASKFTSGLSMSGLRLTQGELDLLTSAYADPSKAGFVNHQAFLDDIDSTYYVKNLESQPERDPRATTQVVASGPLPPLTRADRAVYTRVISRFASAVVSQRMHIKPQFQDMDTYASGKVTPHQFTAVVETFFSVGLDELAVLVKAYGLDDGRIDYVRFLGDVSA